jgi:hypothetical protein
MTEATLGRTDTDLMDQIDETPRFRPAECLPLAGFMAKQRPKLEFHISDLLPYRGKMTFSAYAKFGKSFWGIQNGFALASGNCTFLGHQFGPPCRVLYLQAEIDDSLLEDRLEGIVSSTPHWMDLENIDKNFFIQETCDKRPNLITPKGRKVAEELIQAIKPEVLILDPFSSLCPGLEENDAAKMSLALDYFSKLGNDHKCAIILIHHHGKAGHSRGSSAFEGWPESDLQAEVYDEDAGIAKISRRLRCAFNTGPVYWQTPSPSTPWFRPMPDDWQPDKKTRGPRKKVSDKDVQLVIKGNGGNMRNTELVKGILEFRDVAEQTAQTAIKSAVASGSVSKADGVYSLPKGGQL